MTKKVRNCPQENKIKNRFPTQHNFHLILFEELTDEEKEQIKEFFDMFDRNQDGLISAVELKEVLQAFDTSAATTSDEDIAKFVSSVLCFHVLIRPI